MARSNSVSGTFADTGQSDTCFGRHILIKMDFAGTASVDVEGAIGSNWIKLATVTADYWEVYEAPVMTELRLNCTAHTDNVVYQMQASLSD